MQFNILNNSNFRMASQLRVSCWKCNLEFASPRSRKNHMSSRDHGCMRVVCPFCPKEKLFKRSTPELKEHVASHHPTDLKDLGDKDFFAERNGFWMATTQKTISGSSNQVRTRNAHRSKPGSWYELCLRRQKSQDIGEKSGRVAGGYR